MSTLINDGGQAFPIATDFSRVENGMTLRDYFAGQAIAGMIACPVVRHDGFDEYARIAYVQADAMIAARERKEDSK